MSKNQKLKKTLDKLRKVRETADAAGDRDLVREVDRSIRDLDRAVSELEEAEDDEQAGKIADEVKNLKFEDDDQPRPSTGDPAERAARALEEMVRQNRAKMRVFRIIFKVAHSSMQLALEENRGKVPPGIEALLVSTMDQIDAALKMK